MTVIELATGFKGWVRAALQAAALAVVGMHSAAAAQDVAPVVLKSIPGSNADRVPLWQTPTLSFSKAMSDRSFRDGNVALIGPNGPIDVRTTLEESGTLLRVKPLQELLPATAYTLVVQGAQDQSGNALAPVAIAFHTEGRGANGNESGARADSAARRAPAGATDEEWTPGERALHADWRSGNRHLAAQSLPRQPDVKRALHGDPAYSRLTPMDVAMHRWPVLQKASVSSTSLAGQVLRLNGLPLQGVTLSIGNRVVQTDDNGEFALSQVLVIDGETAGSGGPYGRYEYGVNLRAGEWNVLPFVVWMTRLDTRDAVSIASPTPAPTVITNPKIPGLELRLPAGTVIRDADGKVVTHITMTPIPVDQPPFPIPSFPVPVYFTVQPGGAHLESVKPGAFAGAQLIYPNFTKAAPGTRFSFWDYDAESRGWFVYGQGTVTADGKQVMPDPGVVIYQFSGAMTSVPANASQASPLYGGACCGDPVDLSTGLFKNEEVDLVVPDVIPIVIGRSYRPADDASRGFGIGTNLSYDSFLIGTATGTAYSNGVYTYQDLILPDGARIHYPRISPGVSWTDAVYQNTSTPGKYFGSTIRWITGGDGWILQLTDGSQLIFGDSANSTSARLAAVRSIVDRFGNSLTLVRDGNYNLTQITSPNGRNVTLTYDTTNRVTQVKDDLGRTVSYYYDSSGRLSQVTDPAGNNEYYTYSADTAVNPATSIGGVSTSTNMLTVQDKRGLIKVTNTYDANGRVTTQTYPDGRTMSFVYTLQPYTQIIEGASLAISYQSVGQVDVTDERGVVTRYMLNTYGYPLTVIQALGRPEQQTTTYTRDSTNQVTSIVDPLGRMTVFTYDALGNTTQMQQLANTSNPVTATATYDPVYSQPLSIIDPNGNTLNFTYDPFGRLIRTTDGLGHSISNSYDALGRLTSRQDALGDAVSLSYAGADLASYSDPLGRTTSVFSDVEGRITGITKPLGYQTSFVPDPLDRVTSQTDARGGVEQWSYDPNGNLLTQQDQNKNAIKFTYDPRNRLSTAIDGLGATTSYAYEPGGKISQVVDRKAQLTAITYDGLGRPTLVGYGATTASPTTFKSTISLTWDAGNRLTQLVDSYGGTISRTYDLLDRLISETTPQGTVGYTYDGGGRRTSMTVAGQPTISYAWDAANRLTQIQQAAGASNGNVVQTVTFSYDNADRRTQTVFPNGVVATYTYDAASELTGISYSTSTNTLIGNLTYTYDGGGRRTGMGGTLAQINAGTAASGTSFNANNQLVSWNGTALTYDANGNLIGDGRSVYSWNERDQLIGISGGISASFTYDSFGRRSGKTIAGSSTGFVYDGLNLVQEKAAAAPGAAITANLLIGLGIDELIAREDSTGAYSILNDVLGSTYSLANSSQATVATYRYDAYGSTALTGTSTNDQQFTGRENDSTGLYYLRARYYEPAIGRFISEDPLGLDPTYLAAAGGIYSYGDGNPNQFLDPLGMLTQEEQQVKSMLTGFGKAGETWGKMSLVPSGTILGIGVVTADPFAVGVGVVGVSCSGLAIAAGRAIQDSAVIYEQILNGQYRNATWSAFNSYMSNFGPAKKYWNGGQKMGLVNPPPRNQK